MTTPEIAVQSDRSAQLRRDDLTALRLRRWTREEYDRMIDAGILTTQDKVQLIEGEIVEMTPQKSPHGITLTLAQRLLEKAAGDQRYVRIQLPLALGPDSEPEPDIAVVAGSPRDDWDEHPTTALLVIEVAGSSLRFDRTTKARVYARAGIPEYWIINVGKRCVEVHRDPTPGTPPQGEPRYMTLTVCKPGELITPLGMPDQSVAVDDLVR
jgi:Uma2 family endonuclease